MVKVELSENAMSDLKKIANWHEIKTPKLALQYVITNHMEYLGLETSEPDKVEKPKRAKKASVPKSPFIRSVYLSDSKQVDKYDYSFCKIKSATVNNRSLASRNWTGVLVALLEEISYEFNS